MTSDIDELLERLRKEEGRLRTYASYYVDASCNRRSARTKKWVLSEADLHARFIAAVEELITFKLILSPIGIKEALGPEIELVFEPKIETVQGVRGESYVRPDFYLDDDNGDQANR